MIQSTNEFVQIAKAVHNPKMIASLDVESLFTNVPLNESVEIIINQVYNHDCLSSLTIPSHVRRKLLEVCKSETPFRSQNGSLYQQIDGVSMGSPLGPNIANFYMAYVEYKLFHDNPELKPTVYCRYVDDIFLVVNNINELLALKSAFK